MMGTNQVLRVHGDDDGECNEDGKGWTDVMLLIIIEVEPKRDR